MNPWGSGERWLDEPRRGSMADMTTSPNTTEPNTAPAASPAPLPDPPPRPLVLPAVAPAGRRGTPPPGLSDADAERIAAAIAAARTDVHPQASTPTVAPVGALVHRPRPGRRCPATPPRCAPTSPNAPPRASPWPASTWPARAIGHVHRQRTTCPTRSPHRDVRQVRPACAAPTAPHPAARPDRWPPPRSARSSSNRPHHPDRGPRRRDHPARLRLGDAPLRAGRAHPRRPRAQARRLLLTSAGPRPTRTATARSSPSPTASTPPPTRSPPSPPGVALPRRRTRTAVHPPAATRRSACEPISGDAIARMLRTRAHAAGLAADRITAHSLRAGHATTAALAGVPLDRIAAQTRHKDSPSSSTATSAPSKPWPPPPAATSDSDQTGTAQTSAWERAGTAQPQGSGQCCTWASQAPLSSCAHMRELARAPDVVYEDFHVGTLAGLRYAEG